MVATDLEMVSTRATQVSSSSHSKQRVRLKRGLYKDDIAQVVHVDSDVEEWEDGGCFRVGDFVKINEEGLENLTGHIIGIDSEIITVMPLNLQVLNNIDFFSQKLILYSSRFLLYFNQRT